MNLYLATPPSGRLFYADHPAQAGEILHAVDPPAPLTGRGIVCGRDPITALAVSQVRWPARLFRVRVAPSHVRRAENGLVSASQVDITSEVEDPSVALGPCADRLLRLFDQIEALSADHVQLPADVSPDTTDGEDLSPVHRAMMRAHELADSSGRGPIRHMIGHHVTELAKRQASWLFDQDQMGMRPKPPHEQYKWLLSEGAYLRACAELVWDLLDDSDRDLLCADWHRAVR